MGVEDAITKGFELSPLFGILVVLVVAVIGFLVIQLRNEQKNASTERDKHSQAMKDKEEDYKRLQDTTRQEMIQMMEKMTSAYNEQTKIMTKFEGVLTNLFERQLLLINTKLDALEKLILDQNRKSN